MNGVTNRKIQNFVGSTKSREPKMKIRPIKQKDVGDVPIINTPPIEVDFPREANENPFDCGRDVMDAKIGNGKIAFCCNKHAEQFWKEWSYQCSQLNKTGGKEQNKV